jgi:SAM-dependent methyltransferase
LPHTKIFAIDIDPKMIEFARTNNADSTIEYMTQDIGVLWDVLGSELQQLEGKASLVFSSTVFHWIADKITALRNMSRLLKPGGLICFNKGGAIDFNSRLPEEERIENEKLLKVPSIDEQFDRLRKILIHIGIEVTNANIVEKHYPWKKAYGLSECTI